MKNYFLRTTAAALLGIASIVMQYDATAQDITPKNNIKVFIDETYRNKHLSIMFWNRDNNSSITEHPISKGFFEESLPAGNYQINIDADSCDNKRGDLTINPRINLEIYIVPRDSKHPHKLEFELRIPPSHLPRRQKPLMPKKYLMT